ncbi:ParB N-terminal domain-containing protein [Myroides marinus]|uniref:ParB N-terminal domain-containing protein n=1 Tax=Myroides marinus TaxID=703342 RepID=UPI002574CE4A|nr:ParB N-terminal domain-containing protein [Myroides marinus]MDM1352213.1 ParB N-terminal domain-containing protein [Myroides marinus]MDM1359401.1 ParB N-terminal domain-containing protein [Myroides marinus]
MGSKFKNLEIAIQNQTKNVSWKCDIKKINLEVLRTKLSEEIKDKLVTDYLIIRLDLDKVVENHCNKESDKVFPIGKIGRNQDKDNINRLIDLINNNTQLIPPIIIKKESQDLSIISIIDGNHRIALCRALSIKEIPFIVLKTDKEYFKDNYKYESGI